MRFSTSVDIALQLLVHLAARKNSGLTSAPEVSEALQISYNNVVQIVKHLQNAGLVVTHAGRYGGMELALFADKITIRAVVLAIDGPTKLLPCSHKKSAPEKHSSYRKCNIKNCGIRKELLQLNEQIEALLESVSIASIVARQRAELLQSGEPPPIIHVSPVAKKIFVPKVSGRNNGRLN